MSGDDQPLVVTKQSEQDQQGLLLNLLDALSRLHGETTDRGYQNLGTERGPKPQQPHTEFMLNYELNPNWADSLMALFDQKQARPNPLAALLGLFTGR